MQKGGGGGGGHEHDGMRVSFKPEAVTSNMMK
jgi:hypothetical protein